MSAYRVDLGTGKAQRLAPHTYRREGGDAISPQEIVRNNPAIVTGLPEIGLMDAEIVLSMPEYATDRGAIDVLIVTSDAEIVLVETKLIRNAEATRTVVAQVIDYIKALAGETQSDLLRKVRDADVANRLRNDSRFAALLDENLKTGNFRAIIVGDDIHPNVLAMVESLQAAPHLSFTLHLIQLATYQVGESSVIAIPRIVSSTREVERSVIRIELVPSDAKHRIESSIPEKTGKGQKPILTWEQYLSNVGDPEFRNAIAQFKNQWFQEIEDSLSMGQVGFSVGVTYGGRRVPIQFVYDSRIGIVSERAAESYGIPESLYEQYRENLKESEFVYDRCIAGNRVHVDFNDIDLDTLKLILDSAMALGKALKDERSD